MGNKQCQYIIERAKVRATIVTVQKCTVKASHSAQYIVVMENTSKETLGNYPSKYYHAQLLIFLIT